MSNRNIAISPGFGRRAAAPDGDARGHDPMIELLVFAVFTIGIGFMAFSLASHWMPGLVTQLAALPRADFA